MKLLFLAILMYFSVATQGQTTNPNYDAELAAEFGADDYGMKKYILVILKTGSNQSRDQTILNDAFTGHMENINRLVKANKMIVAGPLMKNESGYRGIFILDAPTFEEASLLLEADPAIAAKFLQPDLYYWYGSAALPAYLDASDKVWKIQP